MPVEILVLGAGAVGAFYGSRLALAPDTRVSVICRSNYKVVKSNGFKILSPQYGSYTFTPANTFPNPEQAQKETPEAGWDCIVVSTKALPDVVDDSKILERLVGDKTAIVLIQNGVGVEEPYLSRFPNASILSAVTIVSAAQPENGIIQHNRWTRINVGPYLPHTDPGNNKNENSTAAAHSTNPSSNDDRATQKTSDFVSLLVAGGITDASAYSHAKLQLVRWHKLAINASMNPSAVLSSGTPNASMALDSELSIHLAGCMAEILTTAPKILGQPFPADFATAEQILRSTRKNTSGSKPSMLLDWEAGRKMELEVILGNPVRIARSKGLEMPRLQSLYALLRMAQENRDNRKAEGKSSL